MPLPKPVGATQQRTFTSIFRQYCTSPRTRNSRRILLAILCLVIFFTFRSPKEHTISILKNVPVSTIPQLLVDDVLLAKSKEIGAPTSPFGPNCDPYRPRNENEPWVNPCQPLYAREMEKDDWGPVVPLKYRNMGIISHPFYSLSILFLRIFQIL